MMTVLFQNLSLLKFWMQPSDFMLFVYFLRRGSKTKYATQKVNFQFNFTRKHLFPSRYELTRYSIEKFGILYHVNLYNLFRDSAGVSIGLKRHNRQLMAVVLTVSVIILIFLKFLMNDATLKQNSVVNYESSKVSYNLYVEIQSTNFMYSYLQAC